MPLHPKGLALLRAKIIIDEAGRMISAANLTKVGDAVKALNDALGVLASLLGTEDSKEEVSESSNNVIVSTEIDPELQVVNQYEVVLDEASKILAQNDSYDAVRSAISVALRKRALMDAMKAKVDSGEVAYDEYYYWEGTPYIRDLYSDYVVYSQSGELFQSSYTVADKEVTLGDATKVQISYVPMEESSKEIVESGDLIQLEEKAVKEDGTVNIKLISPGWGSSGYYSEAILQRDGPKVFKKGLHMYLDHPTEQEDLDRPERSLKDLVGVLESDAVYEKNGKTGPGLYAPAKVFDGFRSFVDEAAPYIGTSIRAAGKAKEGEAEGRRGYIIEGLVEGYSCDYVTLPGRGGQVLPLLEAARTKNDRRDQVVVVESKEERVDQVTEEEAKALRESAATNTRALEEANNKIARMEEGMMLRDARDIVVETLSAIELPSVTRARLVERCSKNPPIVEGALDRNKLIESVKAEATEELKYLSTASVSTGAVVGMGSVNREINESDVEATLTDAFTEFGLSESGLKTAVRGRD